jgi:hypothetical protein
MGARERGAGWRRQRGPAPSCGGRFRDSARCRVARADRCATATGSRCRCWGVGAGARPCGRCRVGFQAGEGGHQARPDAGGVGAGQGGRVRSGRDSLRRFRTAAGGGGSGSTRCPRRGLRGRERPYVVRVARRRGARATRQGALRALVPGTDPGDPLVRTSCRSVEERRAQRVASAAGRGPPGSRPAYWHVLGACRRAGPLGGGAGHGPAGCLRAR